MLNIIDFQIMQARLYQASASNILRLKQEALLYYKTKIGYTLAKQHDSICIDVAIRNGGYPTGNWVTFKMMTEFEVDMHIKAAHELINSEIRKQEYELNTYSQAERILFHPTKAFSRDQILYTNPKNETLSVDDLLRVTKYSIAVAEITDPGEENWELASASITIFQCIEAALNNQDQPMPISKKLHIANGFLSTIVKRSVKNSDTKKGITIASTLIDLVIDFFAGV